MDTLALFHHNHFVIEVPKTHTHTHTHTKQKKQDIENKRSLVAGER